MFNKVLECLFSTTLVFLETEMAGDENQYRFYCSKRLGEGICDGYENVFNCQRSNEVKKKVGFK